MAETWTGLSDAVDVLAERVFNHVAQYWDEAYPTAWNVLFRALEGCDTIARTTKPRSFNWTISDTIGKVTKKLRLGEDSVVPGAFWLHCRNGRNEFMKRPVLAVHSDDFTWNGEFIAFADGLGNGATMHGRVDGLQIRVDTMPIGDRSARKGKPGRRPGPHYDDSAAVEKAVALFLNGVPPKEAKRQARALLDAGQSEDANRRRFDRKFAARLAVLDIK